MRIRNCRTALLTPWMALLPASLSLWAGTGALAQSAPFPRPVLSIPSLPDTHRIDRITVVGARTLSPTAIVVMSGHKEGDPCNDQTLNEIRTNLIQTGNFGMHHPDEPEEWIRVRTEESDLKAGRCNVIVIVDENDKIEQTAITGSGPIKPDQILPLLHPGPVYNSQQLKRDLTAIQDLYHKKGYVMEFGADTGPDAVRSGVLNLSIQVARVTEIRIIGNHKTRSFVVRRELDTHEGDYYNRSTFNADLQRLTNLDLFKEINPSETLSGPGQVRLTLNVQEMKSGTYGGGGSLGAAQGLVGFVQVSDNNFRGTAEAVSLHVEQGVTNNRHTVEAQFVEPWLDRKHTSFNLDAYDKTIYRFSNSLQNTLVGSSGSSNYGEQRTGATLALSRPLAANSRFGISLRGENVHTDALSLAGTNASILQNGPLVALGGSFSRSTLDLDRDPVKGSSHAVNVVIGHADLRPVSSAASVQNTAFGSHNYAKSSVDWKQFISLAGPRKADKPMEEKSAVAMHLMAGSSIGTLPFAEQFFVGGADSVRGYREDRFWGRNAVFGSVEVRQPLARGFKGILFADMGDAWGGSYSQVSLDGFGQSGFHPHASVGLGIRLRSPFGVVRLDYGFGDEGGRAHFGVGYNF